MKRTKGLDMVRKFAGVALLAAAIKAQTVMALGLGEIDVHSALNQPLGADIKVSGTGDLGSDQILVKLASKEDFDRAGVSREYFLSDLQFSVQGSGANTVIRVSTPRPVREPYLDFIVEVKWPSGRLLREYTVLLDIEPFNPYGSVASVAPAARASARPSPVRAQPKVTPVAPRATEAAPAPAPVKSGEGYEIKEGDTLWSIARQVRPSEQVSVKDTVNALYSNNRGAFVGGDINRMEVGRVLRVPSTEDILAQKSGAAPVARPRVEAPSKEQASGPTLDARKGAEQPAVVAEGEKGHLKLAAPETKPAGEGGAKAFAGDEGLKAELSASKELLDKSQRENAELKDKVGNLEKQVGDLERLVSLKDERLAGLQEQIAAVKPAGEPEAAKPVATPGQAATPEEKTAAPVTAAPSVEASKPALPESKPEPVAAKPAQTESTPAAVAVPAPVAKPSAPAPAAKPAAPAAPAQAEDNTLTYLGGAALLVLLGGLGYRALARRREAEGTGSFAPESSSDAFDSAAVVEDVTVAEQVAPEQPAETLAETLVASAPVAAVAEELAPVAPQSADPLSEADIYTAYGRYDQAASLLQSAIAQAPERTDLRLKLLEVLVGAKDDAGFAQAREALASLGDADANAQADALAAQLPALPTGGEPEFSSEFMEVAGQPPEISDEGLDLERELASLELDVPASDEEFSLDVSELEAESGLELGMVLNEESPSLPPVEEVSLDLDDALAELEHGGATELDLDAELASLDLGQHEAAELAHVEQQPAEELAFDEGLHLDLEDLDLGADLGLSELTEEGTGLSLSEEAQLESSTLADVLSETALDSTELGAELDAEAAAPGQPLEAALSDVEATGDEVATKLDLARAYAEMGDAEGAREILNEVLQEGNASQQQEAEELLSKLV